MHMDVCVCACVRMFMHVLLHVHTLCVHIPNLDLQLGYARNRVSTSI